MNKVGDSDSQNELQVIRKNEELQLIKHDFESVVMGKALELAANDSKVSKFDKEELSLAVKNDIDINTYELSEKVEELLDKDENQTNEEIAIKLLEDISLNSNSSFLQKVAKSMLKEKWWEK
ncbi:hypothetical protein COC58_28940 [Bacillus cereus]|nr:hypothetical protein COC58_28940 [Bacillus cereus]